MSGFTIVGEKIKQSNSCDPHRPHRWILTQLLGEYGADWGSIFVYARNIIIPDHEPTEKTDGVLELHFYDVDTGSASVLEQLLDLSYKYGDTRIERTDGAGYASGGWLFEGCRCKRLIMPKVDYRETELCDIQVNIAYTVAQYRRALPALKPKKFDTAPFPPRRKKR